MGIKEASLGSGLSLSSANLTSIFPVRTPTSTQTSSREWGGGAVCENGQCPNRLAGILPCQLPITKSVWAHDIEQVIVWRVHSKRVGVLVTSQSVQLPHAVLSPFCFPLFGLILSKRPKYKIISYLSTPSDHSTPPPNPHLNKTGEDTSHTHTHLSCSTDLREQRQTLNRWERSCGRAEDLIDFYCGTQTLFIYILQIPNHRTYNFFFSLYLPHKNNTEETTTCCLGRICLWIRIFHTKTHSIFAATCCQLAAWLFLQQCVFVVFEPFDLFCSVYQQWICLKPGRLKMCAPTPNMTHRTLAAGA